MSAPASASARRFLSCDWGTSTFRLSLLEVEARRVVAVSRGEQGVAATFAAWRAAGGAPEGRGRFFSDVVAQHLARLARETGDPLTGLPLVISGMASSSLGMRELPYARLPLATDGSDLALEHFPATADFPHPVVIISGVRGDDDVMRGEETQLIGACTLGAAAPSPAARTRLFIFPGTHSKHVEVCDARAVAIRTYMTGEFFALLSSQSILANSVVAGTDLGEPESGDGFDRGVRTGATANLLHAAFRVRARALLEKAAPTVNYHYLSGLLIGAELGALQAHEAAVTLVGSNPLRAAYQRAFHVLGARSPLTVHDADACLAAGQRVVAARLGLV
ncbi:MAG: 2-dehydro-3-deoxygalactonokinase [Opitutaceae bacterium]